MSKNKKQIWRCEVCGQTFFNWENYFKHQQKCREWSKLGIGAINRALDMLKCTFQDTFEIVSNNARYILTHDADDSDSKYEYINMDITCKFKNKTFRTSNYIFNGVNFNSATDIYFRIMQHYILPMIAGFDTYEEYELNKLPKEEQEEVRDEINKQMLLYQTNYLGGEF